MNTNPTLEIQQDLTQLLWYVADHGGGELYNGDYECPTMQDEGTCPSCMAYSLLIELELA